MSAPWLPLLKDALDRQADRPESRWVQLATVRANGRPANRTLVFRGFLGLSGILQFTTDTRSAKVEQIALCPWAAACWSLPETREQFRLTGRVALIDEKTPGVLLQGTRRSAWAELSGSVRLSFAWPAPGEVRDEASRFEVEPPDASTPLPSFGLLLLEPEEVDYLDLKPTPQRRQQFLRTGDVWTVSDRNP
ncbi:hypothetical protein BH23PLA1_BH23PLA1_31310 [soil metagenome]